MQAEYTLLRRAVQQRQVVRCIFKGLSASFARKHLV